MINFPDYSRSNFIKLCIAAVVIRIVWALLIPVIPISDSVAYDTFAKNIWLHGTYGWSASEPTSYWPVGTSAIFSVFYSIFGHAYWPIIVFNLVCSIAMLVFTRLLCDQLFDNQKIGFYAAIILAAWPTLIFYTTVLASELPYIAFLMAAFYYLIQLNHSIIKTGLVSGLLFTVAYYIRPLATVPLAIGVLYLLLNLNDKRVVILRSTLVVMVLVLLVSPWAYRNYQLYNAFVPMSTNGGATLWMGNHPGTNGAYQELPDKVNGMDEYTRNQVLKQEAIDYIKQEPVTFVLRTVNKFINFHLYETIGVTWNAAGIKQVLGEAALIPLKVIGQLYWSGFLFLGLLGIVFFIKGYGFWLAVFHPFTLMWASTAAIHALIVSQDRYHIPIVPLVAAFAAYFMCYIESKKGRLLRKKV